MVLEFLKKHFFLLLAILIAVFGYIYISVVGKELVCINDNFNSSSGITGVSIEDDSAGKAEIVKWETTEKDLRIHLRSQAPGKVYLLIKTPKTESIVVLYVHGNGVITRNNFFGYCTGTDTVILLIVIYLTLILIYLIVKYFMLEKRNLYSYDNVLYLGLIIFAVFFITTQIRSIYFKNGIYGSFFLAMSSSRSFVLFTLPLVVITTICVTASNIKLIRKEGRSWRNMLGVILGLMLGVGAVLPIIIESLLQSTNFLEVHHERGIGRFIEIFFEDSIASVVAYLECILLGTIITGIKTAKHIPKFDKDFIIIHGCQIKKDGTLTPLLKARADRAMEFAKMQKDRLGRPIVFVPSGGKGSDEIISEGEAIKRYLIEQGIPEKDILAETKSTTTEENFKYAYELIRKYHGSDFFKVVFCTTNYHVFRSGMLAYKLGIRVEGIGSKTKRYYWINAFIREFVATIVKEKRTHILVTAVLILINLIGSILMYISEAVLF